MTKTRFMALVTALALLLAIPTTVFAQNARPHVFVGTVTLDGATAADGAAAGAVPNDATVVLTVTGHGLKDPQWALRTPDGAEIQPTSVPVDTASIAEVLGLAKNSTDSASS